MTKTLYDIHHFTKKKKQRPYKYGLSLQTYKGSWDERDENKET